MDVRGGTVSAAATCFSLLLIIPNHRPGLSQREDLHRVGGVNLVTCLAACIRSMGTAHLFAE